MIFMICFCNFSIRIFHIVFHAFSKALIFMCTRIPIHIFNNNQDYRIFLTFLTFEIFLYVFVIIFASFSLLRIRLFLCFYSKDYIIFSLTDNIFRLFLMIIFTLIITFTFLYSLKLIFSTFNYNIFARHFYKLIKFLKYKIFGIFDFITFNTL